MYSLVSLQIRYLKKGGSLVVIGLQDKEEILDCLMKIKSYEDAVVYCNAYGINDKEAWTQSIRRQVREGVRNGEGELIVLCLVCRG